MTRATTARFALLTSLVAPAALRPVPYLVLIGVAAVRAWEERDPR